MGKERETLVVCSDKNMTAGITIWDLETGGRIVKIPTCAAPPHGLVCLRHRFLVASQLNKHGSVGGGAIFTWPLNKLQPPLRSYPLEAIGPVSGTKNGVYLAGGAPSGNAYLWEVTSGRLLRVWRAHHRSLKCVIFSDDDSLLISGSDDGMICVWSMISLLDMDDSGSLSFLLHCLSKHKSSITGLLTAASHANPTLLSSSLDASCKNWDLISGRLIRTREYPSAITAMALHPAEYLLVAGSMEGEIFIGTPDIGLVEDASVTIEDESQAFKGHKGSITSLTFSSFGLLSASEDCTVCLWDIDTWAIIRRFNHQKGPVTNLLVVPWTSLLAASNQQRVSSSVSVLDKCPQPTNSSDGMIAVFPSKAFLSNGQASLNFNGISSLNQQLLELQNEKTPATLEMNIGKCVDEQMWAVRMTKHIIEMNKHLQSRLLDMKQTRLSQDHASNSSNSRRNKKLKLESKFVAIQGEANGIPRNLNRP